ncbi:MAG: ABC transporter ATP-binding protein, partial [Mesorhizobium sp.]
VKKFGDFTALKTMDLAIADGEFMALLGPSGCGKSTTMNMIAGMEEPTSGKILFGERDMAGVPMGRRGVGFVFQNYAIFTHMSVRQNLAYGPKMRGAPKAEIDRRVGAIAEMLQLAPLLDRKADRLSVNILQRVAIGRSAIMEPAIFLLDEPLSNVDAAFRAVMRTELKQLQRQFRQTMIYVTHDQIEAMTMADKIVVLHDGLVEQIGAPLDLYDRPANLFVAGFIGSPAMNFIAGRIEEGVFRSAGGLILPLPEGARPTDAAGRELVYGIRPEHIRATAQGMPGTVTLLEATGSEIFARVDCAGEEISCLFRERLPLKQGAQIRIEVDRACAHLFDAKTGRRM